MILELVIWIFLLRIVRKKILIVILLNYISCIKIHIFLQSFLDKGFALLNFRVST